MQLTFLKMCDDEKEEAAEAAEESISERERLRRREAIRDKIRAVSRFARMYATLRQEQETVKQIKAITRQEMLPRGVLLGGRLSLQQALGDFKAAKAADRPNEKRPPLPAEKAPKQQ